MAPFYRGYEENIRLDQDDIEGIQALYGEKESQVKSVNNVSNTDITPQTRVDNKVDNKSLKELKIALKDFKKALNFDFYV